MNLYSNQNVPITLIEMLFVLGLGFNLFSLHTVKAKGIFVLDSAGSAGSHLTATCAEKWMAIPLVAPVSPRCSSYDCPWPNVYHYAHRQY